VLDSVRRLVPTRLATVADNAWDLTVGGGIADTTPQPHEVLAQRRHGTLRRYDRRASPAAPPPGFDGKRDPVLLVPPLAAPATCFDLRRGCSLVEYLVGADLPTYLVDYGPISWGDRDLGLEHWVDTVLPAAIRQVAEDAGTDRVRLVTWSLGGILSTLSLAAHPDLPVSAIAAVATPFDMSKIPVFMPFRALGHLTGGSIVRTLYHALGGAPAPLVGAAFQLTGIDKKLLKPLTLARYAEDRDALAQVEAVDDYMRTMLAYPGRGFGQMWHRLLLLNSLVDGGMTLGGRWVSLDRVTVPVLAVHGTTDLLAPAAAVAAARAVLVNAPVSLADAAGGHLGVLTGRRARLATWPLIDNFLRDTDPV
jgi:polyhydroxyalkanoate synthase